MVKIRLTQIGKHKYYSYRIVATDSRVKRDGGYLQLLGSFNPIKHETKLDKELVLKYLRNGAQPTETVLNFLKSQGVWAEFLGTKTSAAPTKTSTDKKIEVKAAVETPIVAASVETPAEVEKAPEVASDIAE